MKRARSNSRRLRKQPKMRRVNVVVPTAAPRVVVPPAAKRRRRRNNRRIHFPTASLRQAVLSARWVSVAILAMCIYALLLIGQDETFYLTLIPVDGALTIPPSEIVSASELANQHIFAADPNQAASQIAQLPGIISATVTLQWPNQVAVQVREDAPIALWEQADEDYWVDKGGRLIPARLETTGLLLIRAELDEPVDEMSFVARDVLDGALQLRDLRPNIEALYYRPSGGLSYQDGRGWRVYFGVGLDMAQKLVVYETMVEDLEARGLTPAYVSVSNPAKPYYMAAGER